MKKIDAGVTPTLLEKDAQISDVLSIIALKDGPGQVDLWPSIRDKAMAQRTAFAPRAVFRSRLGCAAVITCLFLTSVVVVLALDGLVRQAIQSDPGLEFALLEERGQALDLAQTVDGFTIKLQWIYADENRIALGYSTQSPPGTDYVSMNVQDYRLTDERANLYPLLMARSGPCEAGLCGNVASFTVPESARPLPETLNLRLTMTLWTLDAAEAATFPTLAPGQTSVTGPSGYGDNRGPWHFEFTVATIPAAVFEVNQTVEAAGVAMTLKRVTVGLSETRAEICQSPSVPDYTGWAPIFTLDTGTDVDWSHVSHGSDVIEGTDCHELSFNAPLSDQKGAWTLTVSEIVGFLRGGTGADQHRISGPWVFRFPVQ